MKPKSPPPPRSGPSPHTHLVVESTPATGDVEDPLVERPDGFYWQAPDGSQEFGPFESRARALEDRDRFNEQALLASESLGDVERAGDLPESIDPSTGEARQGPVGPQLDEH
jgi:hypothetical protein